MFHSSFVGFAKFQQLFSDATFLRVICNTLGMGVINLVVTFVMAIVFAILLNEVRSKGGKKVVQTISFLPHFLSWIIVTGILHDALSSTGIINEIFAIIYLSAITAIDPSLYEAANVDGAGWWTRIKYVTLPGIKPTIMILLLMNVGNVLNAGFEIQYLLGNGLVQSVSQTIDIYDRVCCHHPISGCM